MHPVRETVVGQGADPRARILAAADAASVPSSKTRHLIEQIEAGEDFFGIEALAPAFHAAMASALEYLPPDTIFVLADPGAVFEELRRGVCAPARKCRAPARRAPAGPAAVGLLDRSRRSAGSACTGAAGSSSSRSIWCSGGADGDQVIHLDAEPNTTLRAELAEQRRSDAAQGDGTGSEHGRALRDRLQAFIQDGIRVRSGGQQPHPRRTPAGAVARRGAGAAPARVGEGQRQGDRNGNG